MSSQFVHLRLHTEYSLVDGMVRIKPLIERAVSLKMSALAVTDACNLFGLVKFYKAARNAGIKPIIGADLKIFHEKNPKNPSRLTLLCQNAQGYRNLTQLISRAYQEGQMHGSPMIRKAWLVGNADGLCALSGPEGELGAALLLERDVENLVDGWLSWFPNRFYLEVQRVGKPNEALYLHRVVELAKQKQIPLVATNDVRFLHPTDYEAHEARVCIQKGWILQDSKRPHAYTEAQYFRTEAEMLALFADLPSALANTVELAKRCTVEIGLDQTYLPDFPIPADKKIGDYLTELAEQGLTARLTSNITNTRQYFDRLQEELQVIINMGFSGYFLIVSDFIQWAKNQKIPVGPGRGSGAGSLVAYALSITDIDPIEFDLLFERFLNLERVSMPDFDIDFCMMGRDKVIQYVEEKYGRQNVSQIITYGHMAARAVIRDVGRVLGHPYGFVDKIAKLVPFELGITLQKALQENAVFKERYESEEEVKTLVDLAQKLEGLARNAGKHAGGVVIAPSKLTDFTPLYCEAGGENLVSQFDKDDIELIGLVKFDFLGLKTLTIIDWTVQAIQKLYPDLVLDMNRVARNDEKTFDLVQKGKTTAVFQLESRGMKDLIVRLKPDCFEDIIALVALFRPGPLQSGMVDDFINRKHGIDPVVYPHPALEPILKSTYGVILYQEQVMQIAQVLAGYTLGAADLLRRAMGKKKAEEMAKQRVVFVSGALQNGLSQDLAMFIFDLMEKFVGYGFNKSHSTAYAMLAYQTAWLKAHYPASFMAAVLSADMDNTDKVVAFLVECRNMRLTVLPPSLEKSDYQFYALDQNTIYYGLGAIKGVGAAALEGLLESRKHSGPFRDLLDFVKRVDLSKTNKRVMEAFIRSGTLDGFGVSRSSLLASLPQAIATAEQVLSARQSAQGDLFAALREQQESMFRYVETRPWSELVRLKGEKETLGYYVTGHPLETYRDELRKWNVCLIQQLEPMMLLVRIAGMVVAMRTMRTKRGDKMAFMTLDDGTGRCEIVLFSDLFARQGLLVEKDKLLIVEGEVSTDAFTGGHKIIARNLWDILRMRHQQVRQLFLKIEEDQLDAELLLRLEAAVEPFKGGSCPVSICYPHQKADIVLETRWQVRLEDELLLALQSMLGQSHVQCEYV